MSIKNILLHLATDDARKDRLGIASTLARRHQAHLEVMFMTSASSMPAAVVGRGASAAYLAEARLLNEEHKEKVETEVRAKCDDEDITYTFVAAHGDHNKLLAERSHYADLVVLHQDHGVAFHDHVGLHSHDELVTMTTCAVLIIPHGWDQHDVGRHVLVAWKDSKEASRAIRDAIVFLEQADKVTILTCEKGEGGQTIPEELLVYLHRHGIEANAIHHDHVGDVAQNILGTAKDIGADCICMGAYGHSRISEAIFGGVTKRVLKHAEIPLLMSH